MSESSDRGLGKVRELDQRWYPENISEARLNALLKYTELDSIEAFRENLQVLGAILSLLPRAHNRNQFIPRRGGPTRSEYVLYAQGRILGHNIETVMNCLHNLGIELEDFDTIDRQFIVADERGKITLELLGLVAGYDEDADDVQSKGSNWQAITQAAMERAAEEDAGDDIPVVNRSFRSFPLRGSSAPQTLDPRLRQYFSGKMRFEDLEGDPVALDALIDETARRFEEGDMSLDEAFEQWGLEIEDQASDERMPVPSHTPLGEALAPSRNRKYRWKGGKLFRAPKPGERSETAVSPEELRELYAKAKPAAELLWDADSLSRQAKRLRETDAAHAAERIAVLESTAAAKRREADALPDSLKAIAEIVDIHRGYVFLRVMRFLKRRDVNMAGSYGPNDLMQEGCLGLYRAIARYDLDESRGSFIGFARHHIDGLMLRYATGNRSFATTPVHLQKDLHALYDIDNKADTVPYNAGPLAMSPDARHERRLELAERIFGESWRSWHADIRLDKLRRTVHQEGYATLVPLTEIDAEGLDAVDLNANPLQVAGTEEPAERTDSKRYLSRLLSRYLTPREERVIRARFGIGEAFESRGEHTLEETTAYVPNLDGSPSTRERMRQIEAKALRKLKGSLYRQFGKRDNTGTKYVDFARIAEIFHIEDK